MPKLPHTHLHVALVDGTPLPLVIHARSNAAARDHFVAKHLKIKRLTPEQAFRAGLNGATIEDANADETAADASTPAAEPSLFDTQTLGVPSRPENGTGYASALDAAASL